MNVVIIAPALPFKGGAARFTWELSEFLVNQSDKVSIISMYTNKEIFPESENLQIIDIATESSMTQSVRFWFTIKNTRRKIKQLVEKINPDVVLFMNFPATLWAQKFEKIPIICYPQDIELLYNNTYIKNLSKIKYVLWLIMRQIIRIEDKKCWKFFDQVISHSEYTSKNIFEKYNIKTKTILLGTNTEKFKPTKQKKKFAILTIAAQKSQRNIFGLKSMSEFLKKTPDSELWIVGSSGQHEDELKKICTDLKIDKKVKFFGKVSDEKLIDLYSEALVVIHLVKQPPFGLIVTEAMACGTPVIACHPGGTDETIKDNETGFLINENDGKKLVEYLELFFKNPDLSYQMGKKARERIQKYFELNDKNQELRELMEKWINLK